MPRIRFRGGQALQKKWHQIVEHPQIQPCLSKDAKYYRVLKGKNIEWVTGARIEEELRKVITGEAISPDPIQEVCGDISFLEFFFESVDEPTPPSAQTTPTKSADGTDTQQLPAGAPTSSLDWPPVPSETAEEPSAAAEATIPRTSSKSIWLGLSLLAVLLLLLFVWGLGGHGSAPAIPTLYGAEMAACDAQFEQAEVVYGTPSLARAQARRCQGHVWLRSGRYAEAERQYAAALAEEQTIQKGTDTPLRAQLLTGLADAQYRGGRYAEALGYARQAQAIWDQLPGTHPEEIKTATLLAWITADLGDLDGSQAWFEAALTRGEAVLPADAPALLDARVGNGLLQLARGQLVTAEAAIREAWRTRQNDLGPRHVETLLTQKYWALVQHQKGYYADAAQLYWEAFLHLQDALGPEHPEVILLMKDLIPTLRRQRRLAEADSLARLAYQRAQVYLGSDHPKLAIVLNNLAQVAASTKDFETAERHLLRAEAITREAFGSEHWENVTRLNNLAGLYRRWQQYDKAASYYRRTLALIESHYEDHYYQALTLNNLGSVLGELGRLDEARRLQEEAWEIAQRLLGDAHPETLVGLSRLARTLARLGQSVRAAEIHEALVEKLEPLPLMIHHIEIRLTYANYLKQQNRETEARQQAVRALAVARQLLGDASVVTQEIQQRWVVE